MCGRTHKLSLLIPLLTGQGVLNSPSEDLSEICHFVVLVELLVVVCRSGGQKQTGSGLRGGGVAWWGDGCDRTFDDDDVRSGEKLMERDGMRVAARGTAREKWIRTQRNTS
jgi:hypothetical protein